MTASATHDSPRQRITLGRCAVSFTLGTALPLIPLLLVPLLLVLAFGTGSVAWARPSQGEAQGAPLWQGPDGTALPFRTYEEAKEFLRTARVVSSEDFGVGITGLKRLVLERDGVRARGAFHGIDKVTENSRVNGRLFRRYYDSYKNQCAAYEIARLFGIDNVPPTACRRVNGIDGSVQLWMEGTRSESDQQEESSGPAVVSDWTLQIQTMRLFDSLIYNDDRNRGNYLVDVDWELWMIDHSRAFQMRTELRYGEEIVWCSENLWRQLQAVTDDQIRATVDSLLTSRQLSSLIERRTVLVEHIQKLIDERGEAAVLR